MSTTTTINTDDLKETLSINELAELLHMKVGGIYNRLYRGGDLPPNCNIGGRGRKKIWLKSTVLTWLKEREVDTTFDPSKVK